MVKHENWVELYADLESIIKHLKIGLLVANGHVQYKWLGVSYFAAFYFYVYVV